MTNARGLAFELSQLAPAQREQLLAELPPESRDRMEALLSEITTLIDRPESFDAHMDIAAAAQLPAFSGLNDGQLRLLLGAEHSSVQRRVSQLVRNGQLRELAPAVAEVLTTYLTRKVRANEIRGDAGATPRRWGWRWKRAVR